MFIAGSARSKTRLPANRSVSRAESAHEKDDKADQQNQANSATTDNGTAKVKAAAAEQKKEHNQE